MKLVSTQFVSLDGVYQGPGAPDEDTTDGFTRGGWMVPYMEEGFVAQAQEWLERADALLLGRRTYSDFAATWPHIPRHDPLSDRMNRLPKYVASNSAPEAHWGDTTILEGDVVAHVAALRNAPGRELQIHGSGRLARTLIAAGLVDELRLVISPVIVGQGRRLFADAAASQALRLTRQASTAGGMTILVLERVGDAAFGEYRGIDSLRAGG